MKSEDVQVLSEVFCSVLERESFMFGYVIDKAEAATDGAMLRADLSFSGEIAKGRVSIVLPQPLSLELAANMLGADPDENFVKQQSNDALGELLNVLCGQFLTTVEGAAPVFDLSVPSVSAIDEAGWIEALRFDSTVLLMVEDEYNVLIQLKLDN